MRRGMETVKSVTYAAGRRVATVEQVVSRAEDCEEMGNLYFRLSDLYRRLEDFGDGAESERTAILDDISAVREKIKEFDGYLKGYRD